MKAVDVLGNYTYPRLRVYQARLPFASSGVTRRGMRLSTAFHISAQDRIHPGLIPSPPGTEPLDHFPIEIGRDMYLRLPRPQDQWPLQPGRIRLKGVRVFCNGLRKNFARKGIHACPVGSAFTALPQRCPGNFAAHIPALSAH
jgi:hypothetical protein